MAIFTRFGSKVEIVGVTWDKGWIDYKYPDEPDIHHGYIHDFKADDGFAEIKEACKGLPEAKNFPE